MQSTDAKPSIGDRVRVQWTGMNGQDWANQCAGTITGVRPGGGFYFRQDWGGLPVSVNCGKDGWGEVIEVIREHRD